MTTRPTSQRTDTAGRLILASPRAVYRAFLDPEMAAKWRVPEGMYAQVLSFEGKLGGSYAMAFHPASVDQAAPGTSGPHVDRFTGTFVELIPDEKVVEQVQFESADPGFAQPMIITTTLKAVTGGTKVTLRIENVPAAISAKDRAEGMASSLRRLAFLTE